MQQRIVIDGKVFVSDKPVIKTVHGKTGEFVIGGFYEEKENGTEERETTGSPIISTD